MPAYRSVEQDTTPRQWTPTREILIATDGTLVSTSGPRYDTLDQYTQMFTEPTSALHGNGLFMFADPAWPHVSLLVECEPTPVCRQCGETFEACDCRF